VTAVEPGSAAERSGVIVGDLIAARDIQGLPGARRLLILRGGEQLALTVAPAQSEAAAAA
jgi:hypothetical protein